LHVPSFDFVAGVSADAAAGVVDGVMAALPKVIVGKMDEVVMDVNARSDDAERK